MTDRDAHHESMIRRVEQAQKALSPISSGRSQFAVTARALGNVLDELHERMDMAWRALNAAAYQDDRHYTFRAQKAAELGVCYISIMKAYDDLCSNGAVISKGDKTEPTTNEIAAEREGKNHDKQRRRRP